MQRVLSGIVCRPLLFRASGPTFGLKSTSSFVFPSGRDIRKKPPAGRIGSESTPLPEITASVAQSGTRKDTSSPRRAVTVMVAVSPKG